MNRTKTYIAADLTGDNNAVKQLFSWKENKYLSFDFIDAHEYTQSQDSSLYCSIKASLRTRLDISKTFVLIVGEKTKSLQAGKCGFCYEGYKCESTSNKSFLEYECDKAVRDDLKIVVLYNATSIDRDKCIDAVRDIGTHTSMMYYKDGSYHWDYQAVKNAMG